MNSHDEQHIELAEKRFDHFNGVWDQREAGAATGVSRIWCSVFEMSCLVFRFHVDGDRAAGFDKIAAQRLECSIIKCTSSGVGLVLCDELGRMSG